MATPNNNPEEALRGEILAEARRESEQILRRAQQDAEARLAKAAAEADRARQERLEATRADAARRKELILATVAVETGRLRSARIEALLESVHEEARRRLLAREGFNYRDAVIALAAEALRQMPGDAFAVKLSPADRAAFGDELAGEVSRRVARSPLNLTISTDAAITDGGLILQDAEERHLWDNRLSARLARLWPELRRQIAIRTSLVAGRDSAGGAS